MSLMTEVTIFVLAAFVGFEVISKVPTTLHTPLMSQTNAIHGIIMLGGLIVIGTADGTLDKVIGTIAIAFGTINIVGGFMVTDRMLGMFVRNQAGRLLVCDSGGGRVRSGLLVFDSGGVALDHHLDVVRGGVGASGRVGAAGSSAYAPRVPAPIVGSRPPATRACRRRRQYSDGGMR